jgi:hypothetical protein
VLERFVRLDGCFNFRDQVRLVITDAYRGPDGQALFGPAREAPAGAGVAGQLAALLGRVV